MMQVEVGEASVTHSDSKLSSAMLAGDAGHNNLQLSYGQYDGKSGSIPFRVTPYLSLSKDGASCTLLEVGGVRILLDCGIVEPAVYSADGLSSADAGVTIDSRNDFYRTLIVDVIVLSHADKAHLGALPLVGNSKYFQGSAGEEDKLTGSGSENSSQPVPLVVCTHPVYKFGHMVLYDLYLNRAMEHSDPAKTYNSYDLDDIDNAFSNVYSFKFFETLSLSSLSHGRLKDVPITFCPLGSGRTIGGSMWHIKCETTDICYGTDFYDMNDVAVDGLDLEVLPKSAIFIAASGAKEQVKRDYNHNRQPEKLIDECLATLRWGGNVLIPSETSGRVLELLCAFNEHWIEFPQLAQYKIVFLSHMARNIYPLAKSSLEWVSNRIAKKFFDGKSNPFELSNINFCSSILEMAELDKSSTSSFKIVFATDSTLNYGLSKDILLRWADNPKSKIIFIDHSTPDSVADVLRKRSKAATSNAIPIMISCPERIPLEGTELEDFLRDKQRVLDEEELRKINEAKWKEMRLAEDSECESDDDGANPDGSAAASSQTDESETAAGTLSVGDNSMSQAGSNISSGNISNNFNAPSTPMKDESMFTPGSKRPASSRDVSNSQGSAVKRAKIASGKISRALLESAVMFQSREVVFKLNGYGVSNDDLQLKNIDQAYRKETNVKSQTFMRSIVGRNNQSANVGDFSIDEVHYKTVSTLKKIDVYCDVKDDIPIYGNHSDMKCLQRIISTSCPTKLILLPSKRVETETIVKFCTGPNVNVPVLKSKANSATELVLTPDKINLYIPHSQLTQLHITLEDTGADGIESASKVSVYELNGYLEEAKDTISTSEGIRSFVLKPLDQSSLTSKDKVAVSNLNSIPESEFQYDSTDKLPLRGCDSNLGTVAMSLGEVSFVELKTKIERRGITVDSLRIRDGYLLCDSQVAIKWEKGSNGFIIEGPPSKLYDTIRSIVYEKFAFV